MSEPRHPALFPAIDLRRGRCVRLEQGAAERETMYDPNPLRRAAAFVAAGAEWIHVVDLDAAFGDGSNRELIARLAAESGARIQTGGGLRSREDLEEVLAGDIARVVIGTAAIENPELVEQAVERWGSERIVVGLDARGTTLAIRGWKEETQADLFDLGIRFGERGVRTLLYTDISRDGMLAGPNLPMSIELSQLSGADVLVSGGVGSIED
ncbi:MAG TPA: 1-(5-phosphoribosyl)-5-[(5-phosphoribosylamino)methylideneamino] imidazole-4-carboxamide isomerase, partial [Longimicrobiaceae bacterium]|nr:1-(5-phosphoribosyl)-5-[(5-phosphoribosylamino)methylideneamino] imidazole-4-carboxamide isomerase [Longimicrobiaceae bacterium]